jgi:hypothetical protein
MKTIKFLIITVFTFLTVTAFSGETGALTASNSNARTENILKCRHKHRVWVPGHYRHNLHGRLVWVPGHWRRI